MNKQICIFFVAMAVKCSRYELLLRVHSEGKHTLWRVIANKMTWIMLRNYLTTNLGLFGVEHDIHIKAF